MQIEGGNTIEQDARTRERERKIESKRESGRVLPEWKRSSLVENAQPERQTDEQRKQVKCEYCRVIIKNRFKYVICPIPLLYFNYVSFYLFI